MPITSLTSYFNTTSFGDQNLFTRNQDELALTLDCAARQLADFKGLALMSAGGGAFEVGRLLATTFFSAVPVLSAIPLLTRSFTFVSGITADMAFTTFLSQIFGEAGENDVPFWQQVLDQGSVRGMSLIGAGQSFAVIQVLTGLASVSGGILCEEDPSRGNPPKADAPTFLSSMIQGLRCYFGSGAFGVLSGGLLGAVEQRISLKTKNMNNVGANLACPPVVWRVFAQNRGRSQGSPLQNSVKNFFPQWEYALPRPIPPLGPLLSVASDPPEGRSSAVKLERLLPEEEGVQRAEGLFRILNEAQEDLSVFLEGSPACFEDRVIALRVSIPLEEPVNPFMNTYESKAQVWMDELRPHWPPQTQAQQIHLTFVHRRGLSEEGSLVIIRPPQENMQGRVSRHPLDPGYLETVGGFLLHSPRITYEGEVGDIERQVIEMRDDIRGRSFLGSGALRFQTKERKVSLVSQFLERLGLRVPELRITWKKRLVVWGRAIELSYVPASGHAEAFDMDYVWRNLAKISQVPHVRVGVDLAAEYKRENIPHLEAWYQWVGQVFMNQFYRKLDKGFIPINLSWVFNKNFGNMDLISLYKGAKSEVFVLAGHVLRSVVHYYFPEEVPYRVMTLLQFSDYLRQKRVNGIRVARIYRVGSDYMERERIRPLRGISPEDRKELGNKILGFIQDPTCQGPVAALLRPILAEALKDLRGGGRKKSFVGLDEKNNLVIFDI